MRFFRSTWLQRTLLVLLLVLLSAGPFGFIEQEWIEKAIKLSLPHIALANSAANSGRLRSNIVLMSSTFR